MASFEQHLNSAVIVSGIAIAPLYSASLVDMNQSLTLLAFGMIGGILPDMDSDNSKPVQISFKILSIFLPLLAILTLLESFTISKILFIWVIAFAFLNYVIFKLFLTITVHRGIFHSVPMGILISLIITSLFHSILEIDMLFSILCGIFISIGFMVHLLLDEFISLNALGMDIKRSFGTAFKFYDKNNIYGTISIYTIIIAILFIFPLDTSVFSEIFESFKNIKF